MKVAVLSFAHERAETYVRILRDMPGVEVVTSDPDGAPGLATRGRVMAERLGVSYVDSWDELFATGPHAVVVASEVDRRRELVERAAEAEAHVLCEQPLAGKEADARAMVDACDVGGVQLRLASPACFGAAFAAVRTAIADGAVGTLTTVHGACNVRPPTGGDARDGTLGANAAFLLDLVDAVLGGEPAEQVYAQTNAVLSGQASVESAALLTVRYPSGTIAAIDCSWSPSATGWPVVTFAGDRASVEFDPCPRLLGGFDAVTAGERWEPGGADPYSAMLTEFLTVVDGGRSTGPDGEAGLRAVRIIQAAYESADTGRSVGIG